MIAYLISTAIAITVAGSIGFVIGSNQRSYAKGYRDGLNEGYTDGWYAADMDTVTGYDARAAAEEARELRTGHSDLYDYEERGR